MSDTAASGPASRPDVNTPATNGTQTRRRTRRGQQSNPRNQNPNDEGQRSVTNTNTHTSSLTARSDGVASTSQPGSSGGPRSSDTRRRGPPVVRNEGGNPQRGDGGPAMGDGKKRRNRNTQNRRGPGSSLPADSAQSTEGEVNTAPSVPSGDAARKRPGRREARFGTSLTEAPANPAPVGSTDVKPSEKFRNSAPKKDDLTSTLIHALSTHPYPDCLICFSAIHPAQPTWSCSPSSPSIAASDDEGKAKNVDNVSQKAVHCCWTTFHLKCIKPWAAKSVKEVADAWRARGEERKGEWRCPGCQSKRTVVPSGYWCFCGSTPEPKPPRLATPHSCGNPCTRPRLCGHPCPLLCHPGPCPPCVVTTELPCYCNRQVLSFRCAQLGQGRNTTLSCHQTCGKPLSCGKHRCEKECHDGECGECEVTEKARCWCGKTEEVRKCGGKEVQCAVMEDGKEKRWIGRFECNEACGRAFDCGVHRCSKPCHPPSLNPDVCPRSPSLVTHCPCGKHPLSPASAPAFPPGTLLVRTACTDPIPTCESICMKPLEGCTHPCSVKCHTGPCPPCGRMVVRPCRCGATTRDVPCWEDQQRSAARAAGVVEDEILCDRACSALRACGRHQCNRICCPLASLASAAKKKGKKPAFRRAAAGDLDSVIDEAGWHECDLVCGKMLGCGNHRCEQKDHKGACPPCLRSSFEELICHCGRTVLEPPIPCGTQINCTYTCARPPLPCGHPKTQHACHEDPTPCPPCPFLTTKTCACGKKQVDNVRCSQERVSCGTPCGRLLPCGFHHCERPCHGDACGPCNTPCGKSRKLCLPNHHPCTEPCHAPAACSEAEPCRAVINLTCPCGRIVQPITCGRSTANPAGREASVQLKCSNDCQIAKRNARLAEALGINPERSGRGGEVTYADDLMAFARANPKFSTMVEKTFSDFITSDRKSQILPQMPEARRKFVHDLAAVYRMDTQLVDQEPHRSVQLIRRIDSRIPSTLLSSHVSSSSTSTLTTSGSLGKLADLRAPVAQPIRPRAAPVTAQAPAGRGWTSVVARPPVNSTAASSAWTLQAPTRPSSSASGTRPQSRAASSTPAPVAASVVVQTTPAEVPDSWEDDT